MTDNPPPISKLLVLSGQRALVTGASGNIGRGIAVRLADAGADVVVHYHADSDGAETTARAVKAAGGEATLVQGDLSSEENVVRMFAEACKDENVSLIVNNAAQQPVADLPGISAAEWREVISANLDSAFYVIQAAAAHFREHKVPGAIVNIGSIEGSDPAAGHSHYATSKAGLLMLTRAAALEYGKFNIRVNAVSPGLIDRDGLEDSWPEGVERWLRNAPLGRLGRASDVADAVLFLLSPASRWISGSNLVVDGGMSSVSRW